MANTSAESRSQPLTIRNGVCASWGHMTGWFYSSAERSAFSVTRAVPEAAVATHRGSRDIEHIGSAHDDAGGVCPRHPARKH
jgi:hypothetical protein